MLSRLPNNIPELRPLLGAVVLDGDTLAMGELMQAISFLER